MRSISRFNVLRADAVGPPSAVGLLSIIARLMGNFIVEYAFCY